ncbi:MAG TPA: amino acid ABC transporter permease, partial [Chromatiales bacterium]|nr:amino acid ABC transporter permease [Chromatiales bacterium]
MKRWLAVSLIMLLTMLGACSPTEPEIVIGSKNFTESVILGEMLRILASDSGAVARHQRALGGTRLVFSALASGEIDAYVEYTGTLIHEIFANDSIDNQ